jgi:hypothetical protein
MLGVSRHLIGFRWSRSVKKLLVLSAMMVALSFGLTFIALGWIANAGGGILTLAGSIISLRSEAVRSKPSYGSENTIVASRVKLAFAKNTRKTKNQKMKNK